MTFRHLLHGGTIAMVILGASAFASSAELTRSLDAQLAPPLATPNPTSCTVAPRPVKDLLATPTTEASYIEMRQTLPDGHPADPATVADVTRTVRELEACVNTAEFLRFVALFTDAALQQHPLNTSEASRAELKTLVTLTPTPLPPGQRVVFAGPWHLEVLPDGRVAAAVVWFGSETDTCIDPNRIRVLLFVHQNGRWLIDEVIERVVDGELSALVGPPDSANAIAAMCLGAPPAIEPASN